jgi:hypothetical protein
MRYGNCLSGAIYGMLKMRTLKIRRLQKGFVPHFYLIKDGKKWHYSVVHDVLPFPFGLFFYRGELKQIK